MNTFNSNGLNSFANALSSPIEDENDFDVSLEEIYEKTKQLMNCDEMEDAHEFLYNIDFDNLNASVVEKVNDLYDLAVSRGFIALENPDAEWQPEEDDEALDFDSDDIEKNEEDVFSKDASDNSAAIDSAYSVLYTATKHNEVKSGECYSNAADPKSAKIDAISKLANLGFDNIEILAVEFGPKETGLAEPELVTDPAVPEDVEVPEEEEIVSDEEKTAPLAI